LQGELPFQNSKRNIRDERNLVLYDQYDELNFNDQYYLPYDQLTMISNDEKYILPTETVTTGTR